MLLLEQSKSITPSEPEICKNSVPNLAVLLNQQD